MGFARSVAPLVLVGCYQPVPERACSVACAFNSGALCPGELTCFPDNFCHDPAHPQCGDSGGDGSLELHNYAFVTSAPFAVGTIGSIAAADAVCQQAADAVPLAGTFHAWLATAQTTAQTQLGSARGWVRTDHRPFVDRAGDLINNQILYPLRVDEFGVDHLDPLPVATGSTPDGTAEFTCGDYTIDTGQLMTGHADAGIFKWTEEQTLPCNSQAPHLYCFGVDHDEAVVMTPPAGKRAFVSDRPFGPSSNGRDDADARCALDANDAGLVGTFLAVLATTTESAGSRFGSGPWFRLDGVEIGTLDKPIAPLEVTPTLMHYSGPVWTGATSLNALGTAATTCGDWVLFGGTGAAGQAARSEPNALFFEGTGNCTDPARVYCLEP